MVSDGFADGFAGEGDGLLQLDVGRRAGNLHHILARCDVPLALALVAVVAELLGEELRVDGLALAGCQRDAGEALQLQWTDGLLGIGGREVDLCNLVGSHLTGVLHLERDVDGLCRCGNFACNLQVAVFERGVAQTIAEGPLHIRCDELGAGGL